MTVVSGPSVDTPARAEGVRLIGEMKGSGYRTPPALARRGDGQTVQLTPLVYLVLEAIDGTRNHAQIAESVSDRSGRAVSEDNVRTLVDEQLRPAGLVTLPDGSQPEVQKSNPLLGLRFKYAVTDEHRTRRLTTPFTWLFNPVIVVVVVTLIAIISWWVLFDKGLASATNEAFAEPSLLLLVVAVTVLSAGFHEFGHAAAARRAGAQPGAMGAGLYLLWPAFYTDVTDSYRLGRGGRLLTDLGGLYFNAIVAVGIIGIWWATRFDALLLIVATQILQMVRQLIPLVRFDGYHVLADLTGVPDLFQRIKPTLLGILPWRWRDPEATILKPWARAVVTAWVLLVVPILVCTLYLMVIALPRILGTAWAGAEKQTALLTRAWSDGDLLEVSGRAVGVLAVLFPAAVIGLILIRVIRRLATRTWVATRDRPARRAVAGLLAIALTAALVAAWWPRDGAYRPVQAYEGGTLMQAAQVLPGQASGVRVGARGVITTAWAEGAARPTRDEPQLAMVLLPRQNSGGDARSWVFPFNRPLAPGAGDNQALSVNTSDGRITYDVAFALVWIDDDSPALNRNEAYAFASCKDCAAVAVGFQVVLVTGDNHVAAPVNIAAAVNHDCVNCLTYALAVQLFVTIDEPLDEATMSRLDELWREIAAYGSNIASVPLDEIEGKLEGFETEILATLGVADPDAPASPSPESSAPADDSASASASPEATPSEATATPSEEPASGEPASDSPAPEPEPSEDEVTEPDSSESDAETSPVDSG